MADPAPFWWGIERDARSQLGKGGHSSEVKLARTPSPTTKGVGAAVNSLVSAKRRTKRHCLLCSEARDRDSQVTNYDDRGRPQG